MGNTFEKFSELIEKLNKEIENNKIIAYAGKGVDEKIIDFCKENEIEVVQHDMLEDDKIFLVPKGKMKDTFYYHK